MGDITTQKLLQKGLIWFAAAGVTFVLFYFFLPATVIGISQIILTMVAASLMIFFIFKSISMFMQRSALLAKEEYLGPSGVHLFLLIVLWFGVIVILLFHYVQREQSELNQYGQKTTGTIVGGSGMETRHGENYTVKVSFTTIEGSMVTAEVSVGKENFQNLYEGQQVELIYSTKNPNLVDLLLKPEDISTYSGSDERKIGNKDLFAILETDSSKLKDVLYQINSRWEYQYSKQLWMNPATMETLTIMGDSALRYVAMGSSSVNPYDLKEMGFSQDRVIKFNKPVTYESNNYRLIYEKKYDQSNEGTSIVIDMMKKN